MILCKGSTNSPIEVHKSSLWISIYLELQSWIHVSLKTKFLLKIK